MNVPGTGIKNQTAKSFQIHNVDFPNSPPPLALLLIFSILLLWTHAVLKRSAGALSNEK